MKWWWSDKNGESMTEDDFFEMIELSLCSDFIEYLEVLENKGYYIPFITTINYLTHPVSRNVFKIKEYTNLKN
jgi:hypothetical protein